MSTTSNHQDDREFPAASAAEKNAPRSKGVQEHKCNRPEPPSPTSNAPIFPIRERLARIINLQLERMESGEISQLFGLTAPNSWLISPFSIRSSSWLMRARRSRMKKMGALEVGEGGSGLFPLCS